MLAFVRYDILQTQKIRAHFRVCAVVHLQKDFFLRHSFPNGPHYSAWMWKSNETAVLSAHERTYLPNTVMGLSNTSKKCIMDDCMWNVCIPKSLLHPIFGKCCYLHTQRIWLQWSWACAVCWHDMCCHEDTHSELHRRALVLGCAAKEKKRNCSAGSQWRGCFALLCVTSVCMCAVKYRLSSRRRERVASALHPPTTTSTALPLSLT